MSAQVELVHSGKRNQTSDILEIYKIPTNTGPTKWIVIDPVVNKKLTAIVPSRSITTDNF